MVFATEKFLAENGEKVPAEVKTDVESKLGDLKGALGGSDVAAIRSAADELSRASQAMGGVSGMVKRRLSSGSGINSTDSGSRASLALMPAILRYGWS